MLTADQIEQLRTSAERLLDPIVDYLIQEIAKRISQAGQLTATAQYQIWRAQQLGLSQAEIKRRVRKLLRLSQKEAEKLFKQAAETGYNFDLDRLPTTAGIPFAENTVLQSIVKASTEMATEELENITQTLGFVGPFGQVEELTKAYIKACDFAFLQVSTGAESPASAVRQAVAGLRKKGIQHIDYASGKSYSVEAAIRRNVYSAAGIMEHKISEGIHDDLGCDGWEISAHGASAPDHEPIQGKQYKDDEYESLNNSLVRRVGTLNCGHSASPIIYGVSRPIYTPEQLEKLREENEKGIEIDGKHYTLYEATQKQRRMERGIRETKRSILIDEATKDAEQLQTDQIKYHVQEDAYQRFSKDAGLKTQYQRAEMYGFGPKQANAAEKEYKTLAKKANTLYDVGSEEQNIAAYRRDLPIREKIGSEELPLVLFDGRQNKHIAGTNEYRIRESHNGGKPVSTVTISKEEIADLVQEYHGKGILLKYKNGTWNSAERITGSDKIIGTTYSDKTEEVQETSVFVIHYAKDGYHIVPDYMDRKGKKQDK